MRRLRDPTVLALLGLVVVLGSVIGFDQLGQDRDERDRRDAQVELVQMQRAGCERSKLDRADNAAAWTAHRTYIESVTRAASVKEDVKRAARHAARTYRRVAASLTKRSQIDCSVAFPLP